MTTSLLLSMPGGSEWILIILFLVGLPVGIFSIGYKMGISKGENNILKNK